MNRQCLSILTGTQPEFKGRVKTDEQMKKIRMIEVGSRWITLCRDMRT
jgi:hypothetical protein